MAAKPNNIAVFHGEGYGSVRLVKRSLSYRLYNGGFRDPITGCLKTEAFWFWRGQLVDIWEGTGPRHGEKWGPFYKGQHVWLRAEIFKRV